MKHLFQEGFRAARIVLKTAITHFNVLKDFNK
jgi:hypothetical protein